jgi:hypothetical protein
MDQRTRLLHIIMIPFGINQVRLPVVVTLSNIADYPLSRFPGQGVYHTLGDPRGDSPGDSLSQSPGDYRTDYQGLSLTHHPADLLTDLPGYQ